MSVKLDISWTVKPKRAGLVAIATVLLILSISWFDAADALMCHCRMEHNGTVLTHSAIRKLAELAGTTDAINTAAVITNHCREATHTCRIDTFVTPLNPVCAHFEKVTIDNSLGVRWCDKIPKDAPLMEVLAGETVHYCEANMCNPAKSNKLSSSPLKNRETFYKILMLGSVLVFVSYWGLVFSYLY